MTEPQAKLADLLSHPLADAARLVLSHRRRRSFRWLALLELPVKLVFLAVLLIVILVVSVVMFVNGSDRGGGGADDGAALPGLSMRFFHYWHELALVVFDKDGARLHEVTAAPPTAGESDAIVAAVLSTAHRQGLVVVETLGARVSETLEIWYGGQPLMAHPEQRDVEASVAVLREYGFVLREATDSVEIIEPGARRSRIIAFILLALGLALLPLVIWFRAFRRGLANVWLDLRGVEPNRRVLVLERDGRVALRDQRGNRVDQLLLLESKDLVGIAYSATLGHDRDVTRHAPTLRLVTQNETHSLPYRLEPPAGRALRDYLVAKAITLWEGSESTELRPTRCPYCAALYTFEPGVGCPSCGGWPDKVAG